ncbi:hypothetical protein CVT24_006148 [Panaeolus cyanescens]|uniref:F-box domain-containing protein n=1 Tax=Panaeolus cyanescens TaxID=181874 RepID=A0A409VZV1_9AGAR|nr:hypothetical protein CVT24_006148 [Panaeolus cyanescens]
MTLSMSANDSAPVLPLEIIHQVFYQLHPHNDKTTLANCALIAPSLQSIAQERLYSSITLSYVLGWDKEYKYSAIDTQESVKLLRSLTNARHLANLVQRLEIRFSDNTLAYSNMKSASVTATFVTLDSIVGSLTCLRAFTVSSPRTIYWGTISDSHQLSIVEMLKANPLEELGILCFSHFPRALCGYSSTLKNLTITNIDEHGDPLDKDCDKQMSRSAKLDSLTIGWSADGPGVMTPITKFITSSTCALDISNLTTLNFATKGVESWDISPLLAMCSNTLTSLTITVPEEGEFIFQIWMPVISFADFLSTAYNKPSYPIVELYDLVSLSHLRINGRVLSRWIGSPRHPSEVFSYSTPWIGALLRTLPFDMTNSVDKDRRIEIFLDFIQVSSKSVTSLPWEELVDGILCHASPYNIKLHLSFEDYFLPQYAEPLGHGIFEDRIRILKEDVNLQRLGEDLVIDTTERFSTPTRRHPFY